MLAAGIFASRLTQMSWRAPAGFSKLVTCLSIPLTYSQLKTAFLDSKMCPYGFKTDNACIEAKVV